MSASDLADLLKRTANAHHVYEAIHGPDPEWWNWYAAFMTRSADITIRHHNERTAPYEEIAALPQL